MSALATFKNANERLLAARATCETVMKDAFNEGAREIFASHPVLEAFSWTQYAPYFNDGDACEFSAHTDYPNVLFKDQVGEVPDGEEFDDEDDSYDDEAWDDGYWVEDDANPTDKDKAYLAVKDFLKQFDEDLLRNAFGDSVRVVVTDACTAVEEYEHD